MKRLLVIASIAAGIAMLIFLAVFPYTPGGRQRINFRLADQHAEAIQRELAEDARFDDIEVGRYTGQGGAIWIIGDVADDESALALRQLVEETEPPVAVKYTIRRTESD